MNYDEMYRSCVDRLVSYCYATKTLAAANRMDRAVNAELLICDIANVMFECNLRSLKQGPIFDLADDEACIAIQVTFDGSMTKLDSFVSKIQNNDNLKYKKCYFFILDPARKNYNRDVNIKNSKGEIYFCNNYIINLYDISSWIGSLMIDRLKIISLIIDKYVPYINEKKYADKFDFLRDMSEFVLHVNRGVVPDPIGIREFDPCQQLILSYDILDRMRSGFCDIEFFVSQIQRKLIQEFLLQADFAIDRLRVFSEAPVINMQRNYHVWGDAHREFKKLDDKMNEFRESM
ncbi:SMEK domain-containing protein [Azorhizobium doebereinerae]|uniref:SMEK domain-containing protein n=1 Tax=Azorhizobium doebereinerae TaxID=281091 RepID=UPI0012EBB136|nr:SMEK domain-containing protein [Azorhizobium doebereinerae]